MFRRFFGPKAGSEPLDGPFWKTVRSDHSDYALDGVRFVPGALVTVTPNQRDTKSYIVASRAAGDAIFAGAWDDSTRLVVLRGNPKRDAPGGLRFALFDRVYVDGEEPTWRAFGDNGLAVERFLHELGRRGRPDADDRIPSKAWLDCQAFLQVQQHDPNAEALSRAGWDAAYKLAEERGMVGACDAASDIAKDDAMRAAHLSEPTDQRAAAIEGSDEWKTANETITVRATILQWSPLYKGEGINVAAGLTCERAALAVVMQNRLAPDLFAALTEPMRRFVDPTVFGAL